MFAVILQKSSLLFEKATKAKDRDDESVDKAMVLATSKFFSPSGPSLLYNCQSYVKKTIVRDDCFQI